METGSEGESNRNTNDINGQSDGSKRPRRQMKTPYQLDMLEKAYLSEMYPSESTRAKLAVDLGLKDRQLQMWFCHRRLKDKKEVTLQRPVGENMEFMRSSQQQLMVVERGGGAGGSENGSRSRSRHESLSRSRSVSGPGSGSESDSSEDNEPMGHSRAYELTQQNMMRRRIIECVEMQLGEALRKDGPELGIEFDELPPGAFGMPIAVPKMHHSQNRHSYEGNFYDPQPIKIEAGGRNIKYEPYATASRSYGSPSGYTSDPRLLLQNGLQTPYATPRQLKGKMGHLSSPINDNDYSLPTEEVMQMWRKRKSEEGVAGLDGHSDKRMKKELEKNHMLTKKREEQIKKDLERQRREGRKEAERISRERQKQRERYDREQQKAEERQQKFLQKESEKAERRKQKEDLRREREAIKQKASVEKAAAKKFAKESMELIEDERLELLELAASSKGLTSIASLDYETLQTLDSFRDQLRVFPPKSVQLRLKRPFSVHPWIDSEENVGNLFMVWRFCMTFADILGLWPFTLDEFVQSLHDYDSRLLGEVHIALLKLIIRDIEDVARTPSGGPGTNQYTVANPEGGHPQIVEGAYAWGFDIRNWLRHLNPLTWPEVLRQFALSAGFGPQLKKDKVKRSSMPEMDEGKDCEDVITMLRNGSAAENAALLMQEKGAASQPKKSRHRLTPGTVKFAAYHVLCLEGDRGLNVLDIAAKIQKTGLRDLTTSKTPDASISVALSRDPILFERVAPSTYCVRPPHRKDPATADEVIATAKERIQNFAMTGMVNVEDVEKDEDLESEVAEGQEIDLGTPSTVTEGDVEMKTASENAAIDQGNTEIDEKKSGESWVQGLTEGEYSDLSVEERLNALVALISVANEGNIIRLVLEDRLDAATAVRKQMWAEAQLDKRRLKEEFISKFQESSPMPATEGIQSPMIPLTEGQDGYAVGQTVGQMNNNGYNTAERSRLQLKAYIGHKAEEMYVYRSLPLGQDRRRNRYWQFVASTSSRDPGSGRIFVELQSGGWRLIDSEEVFDAFLPLLDTRGARESHLHVMLQKIETSFKESIRRNSKSASDSNSTDSSPTFNIELGETDLEKKNGMERYRDLEKWMWKQCLYKPRLLAMTHGKQRSTPLQGICDFCHGSYCFEKAICPRCHRSFSTLGDKLCYPEPDIQDNVRNSNDQNDWDITHPIRIRLIKSLLAYVEASVPSEALQASWTENIRNMWGSKLHGSLSPTDLLQVLTWFESVVRRDYLSLSFETTEELLKISGLSDNAALDSGSVPVLPWVPQTTAAVTLRLFELDGLISYTPEQKVELDKENELNNAAAEKSPLKFTFLKNVGKTADTPGHVKPMKPPRGSGGRPRGSNGKWTKRTPVPVAGTPGPVAVSENRQNVFIRDDFAMSQVMTPHTHGTGPRTIRKRKPETMVVQEEPMRNFMHQAWINGPVHQMRPQNMNYHVGQEEEEESESDDEQVGFENARYGESSGYGIANNQSRWVETEISDDDGLEDDEMMNHGYVDGNDRRNFNGEDSDSDGLGEYSD